ncbi:MAG: phage capsid protein [Candidatus Caldarchaeum sp.]
MMSETGTQEIVVPQPDYKAIIRELLDEQRKHYEDLLKTLKQREPPVSVPAGENIDAVYERFAAWLTGVKNDAKARESASEAVSGVPATFDYSRDLIHLPSSIRVGLRKYSNFVTVSRGANQARWFTVDMPTFNALTSKTAPTAVTHTITTVTATLSERGASQIIGYEEIEQSVIDLVKMIDTSFLEAAVRDEDKLILAELDTNTNVHYAGGNTAENTLTASDKLTLAELITAKRKLIENAKYVPDVGDVVLVCSPKQYFDLLSDTGILKALEYGSDEPVKTGVVTKVLGIGEILVTDNVSTGSGSGTPPVTTYRAHLFIPRRAFGLAVGRDLLVEAFREPPKRAITITASYTAGAKLIDAKSAIKIVTT